MNNKTDIEQLIIRYLNGECSVIEQNKLLEWIELSSANKKSFYSIKDVWDASQKKEDSTNEALLKFYKLQAFKGISNTKIIRLWKTISGIAAVFVIGIISLYLLNILSWKPEQIQSEYTSMVYKVPFGSRTEVNLPDGTIVMLNSGSELKYSTSFLFGKREVSLSGEAFFQVKSDITHPFFVKTNDLKVKVTGTKFNVCSYNDDDFSKIFLEEGKVGIIMEQGDKLIDITPGQQFYLDKVARKYNVIKSDLDIETSWKEGEFMFREINFSELIKRLERWYDVTLTFSAPELEKMLYSGNFKNQETIWQVLDALKLTTPIDYKKTGFREFEIMYKP